MRKNQKKESIEKLDSYQWLPEEKALLTKRKKRFEEMYKFKQDLGIDKSCDRFDALFTPHLVHLNDGTSDTIQSNTNFGEDTLFSPKMRKSVPLLFEKVTTAQSLLIRENPKCRMIAGNEYYKENSPIIQHTYYENFRQQKKKEVLKKYIYQLAKYGKAYWREFIKKTYRMKHVDSVDKDGNLTTKTIWVYDVNDVVGEVIHPKMAILDNSCISVKDVNKPAVDLIIQDYLTKDQFDSQYPKHIYPVSEFVKEGQGWMLTVDADTYKSSSDEVVGNDDKSKRIQILTYENRFESVQEIWANGLPLKSIPLPGDELSLNGDKWIEDKDNYDAIGLGHIVEIYQPIIDDIINASNERLRQMVRPNEDRFNGITQSDESEDTPFGSSNVRTFEGGEGSIKYTTPPARSDAEVKEKEEMYEEIDRAGGVPRNLSGGSNTAVKTAYQDAMLRESALQKFNLPLASIKKTLEDAANLDLALYQIAYSEPIETLSLKQGDAEFDEGLAIIEQAKKFGIDDERVAVIEKNEATGEPTVIARRKFRTFEMPIKVVSDDKPGKEGQTKVIETDEKTFWENIPKDYNWQGYIEIIGESFLPTSKTLEDTQDKETIEYLMNVPITDEMGRPTLKDATGVPFTIDKVRLVKERCKMNKNFDPDKYIVPLTTENAGAGNISNSNPLESETDLSAGKINPDLSRPEVSAQVPM